MPSLPSLSIIYLTVFLSCIGTWANRSFSKPSRTHKLPDLYWNTSNPIFRIDNTDHIMDVNEGALPHEYDQINIRCPVYPASVPEEETEKYVIYNVEREEYELCRIQTSHPRIVAYCTEPYKERFFTISFRSFSPVPNTLEFKPGHDYFFISTSSKDDLHRRVHGDCRNHNMKVVFKVASDITETNRVTVNHFVPKKPRLSTRPTLTPDPEDDRNGHPPYYTYSYTTKSSGGSGLDRNKIDWADVRQDRNSFHASGNEILLNDKPHESLVKKVREKIKQEASTKIAGDGHRSHACAAAIWITVGLVILAGSWI